MQLYRWLGRYTVQTLGSHATVQMVGTVHSADSTSMSVAGDSKSVDVYIVS